MISVIQLVSYLAIGSSLSVYVAGSKTVITIVQNKSTGSVTLFPFVACLYSAAIWLKYGLLTNTYQMIVTNTIATVCQVIYIIVYYIYARERHAVHRLLCLALPFLYGILAYAKLVAPSDEDAAIKLGLIGTFVAVVSYASPLISLREVIRTRSCRTIDFGFVVTCFACCILWSTLGILIADRFVLVPNAIGLLFTTFQLSLFVMYPAGRVLELNPTSEDGLADQAQPILMDT